MHFERRNAFKMHKKKKKSKIKIYVPTLLIKFSDP